MVVAQLVEWSLSIPEAHGSTPVIGKLYITYLLSKDENKRKRGPNFQKTFFNISSQTHGCPRKNLSRSWRWVNSLFWCALGWCPRWKQTLQCPWRIGQVIFEGCNFLDCATYCDGRSCCSSPSMYLSAPFVDRKINLVVEIIFVSDNLSQSLDDHSLYHPSTSIFPYVKTLIARKTSICLWRWLWL